MKSTGRAGWAIALMICAHRWVDGQDSQRRDVMLWETNNIKKCWMKITCYTTHAPVAKLEKAAG